MENNSRVLNSAVEAIGSTHLVELSRFVSNSTDEKGSPIEGRILAKMEYLNPGFSKVTISQSIIFRKTELRDKL